MSKAGPHFSASMDTIVGSRGRVRGAMVWQCALEDVHHAACLRIPQSFYKQLTDKYGSHFREHATHHQYMMLHKVYQLRRESCTVPPRDEAQTQPSQSIGAWYGKIKPQVCTPNLSPQALQQQVLCKPSKQKRAKVKKPFSATHTSDKECHRILQGEYSYLYQGEGTKLP